MQDNMMQQGQPMAEEEQGGSVIMLNISGGAITISADGGDPQPVRNINEALMTIKQMAQAAMGGNAQDAEEQSAFDQEFGRPSMRKY